MAATSIPGLRVVTATGNFPGASSGSKPPARVRFVPPKRADEDYAEERNKPHDQDLGSPLKWRETVHANDSDRYDGVRNAQRGNHPHDD
jgi:hypothetical protein